ncbi:MAG: hypothetical protein OEZ36_08765 [Spirochaetota bacterium]|nr:hypothetical protein [Spirochaetota bacterium]
MKKLIFILTFLLSIGLATKDLSAKGNKGIDDGDLVIYTGVGYGLMGMYADMVIPPLSVGIDYCVKFGGKHPVTFGGMFGFAQSEYVSFSTTYTYNYYIAGFRGAYHFTEMVKVDGLDLYAGMMIGYNIVDWAISGASAWGYTAGGSYVIWGVYGGVRYYFTDNIGVYAEGGYGVGFVNAGLAFKL